MRTNIVTAEFKGGMTTRTQPVYQYDYGQVLTFSDLELPESYEVHFARGSQEAIVVIGDANGVMIPDVLLQRGSMLTAYIYLHTGTDDGETVYIINIPVISRAPIGDEQPEPVEIDAISQAIAALNNGVETVQSAVDGIEQTVQGVLAQAKASGEFDGAPGRDGTDGEPGEDGISPTATVSKSGNTATITIIDKNGTTSTEIIDGTQGDPGVSPVVTVTDITGGHRITITDATGAHSFDVMDGQDSESGAGAVQDVQVNGVSVVEDGVANVPIGTSTVGVVSENLAYGIDITSTGQLLLIAPTDSEIKRGLASVRRAIQTMNQHQATFYGLAKAAGADEKNSTLPVGQYTESAKSAISEMLSGSVSVSGTTPMINALPGIRYVCGKVTTLDIVTPATGIVDVVFESGSTPAVLTVVPPTGMTMKWANGFDPTSLEADTVYEINIADGCLGVAGTWS